MLQLVLVESCWRLIMGDKNLRCCPTTTFVDSKVYLQTNNTILTVQDILTATGATAIKSITVKQVSGQGKITGDSGNSVQIDSKESWSWSETSNERFNVSALSFNADTGVQRVTATYI
jgi:hypothetical protein